MKDYNKKIYFHGLYYLSSTTHKKWDVRSHEHATLGPLDDSKHGYYSAGKFPLKN